MRVEVTAPCRADLAGGTLDIWPLGVLHPGSITVNVAIPVQVRLEVDLHGPAGSVAHSVAEGPWRTLGPEDVSEDLTAAVCYWLRPDAGVRVRVINQAPVGSGLGGSSTYAVALAQAVQALEGLTLSDRSLVALLRDLEARVLGAPTGIQDHWAAVKGGVTAVHLDPGQERIEAITVDQSWLEERMSVYYTGMTHHSGMVNWKVIRRRLDGEPETAAALEAVAEAARCCREGLWASDEVACAAAIAAEWSARRRLAPEVCPADLDRLEGVARGVGATAFKACGAGGGGSVLLWHPPGLRPVLDRALLAAAPSGFMIPAGIAAEGCRISVDPHVVTR